MLRITNHSENYDGVITIDNDEIAIISGSLTEDNAYANFSSSDITAIKTNVGDVSSDVAEFMQTLLSTTSN